MKYYLFWQDEETGDWLLWGVSDDINAYAEVKQGWKLRGVAYYVVEGKEVEREDGWQEDYIPDTYYDYDNESFPWEDGPF